ncbi:hypothetical protein [Burkholderia ubonensis]|uniref:hypothetical protein n=1 Tax=Burkholderia ubonensis TaxID=101571 RepID=UPI000759B0A1|nr:hypothetical protein [Burkholderia ubonensis]KVT50539.1 hypothetical protein WK54_23420 [Burkholderia ubonensis]
MQYKARLKSGAPREHPIGVANARTYNHRLKIALLMRQFESPQREGVIIVNRANQWNNCMRSFNDAPQRLRTAGILQGMRSA